MFSLAPLNAGRPGKAAIAFGESSFGALLTRGIKPVVPKNSAQRAASFCLIPPVSGIRQKESSLCAPCVSVVSENQSAPWNSRRQFPELRGWALNHLETPTNADYVRA
jgi:hypothetical protein